MTRETLFENLKIFYVIQIPNQNFSDTIHYWIHEILKKDPLHNIQLNVFYFEY